MKPHLHILTPKRFAYYVAQRICWGCNASPCFFSLQYLWLFPFGFFCILNRVPFELWCLSIDHSQRGEDIISSLRKALCRSSLEEDLNSQGKVGSRSTDWGPLKIVRPCPLLESEKETLWNANKQGEKAAESFSQSCQLQEIHVQTNLSECPYLWLCVKITAQIVTAVFCAIGEKCTTQLLR